MTEPLAGAVLISPWVEWVPQDVASEVNLSSDIVTKVVGSRWSVAIRGLSAFLFPGCMLTPFVGNSPTDNWQEPALAEVLWFKDLKNVVKDILVWTGKSEVLTTSIVRFAKIIDSVHPRVELVEQPGAGHEDMITCRLLHISAGDDHTKLIQAWIEARV